jgi:DNA-binding GntR family transcriptional regulator
MTSLDLGRIDRPASLAEQAYESIRGELLAGHWGPDERLTEGEVARRFSISRTPAREALRRLVMIGSLEALPGGGYAQRTYTARMIREHYDLRALLEPEAAALAAQHGAALDALAGEGARQAATDATADRHFHVAIAEASGNGVLAGLVRALHERTAIRRRDGAPDGRLAKGHAQIVAALEAGDPAAAFAATHDHIRAEEELMLVGAAPR